MTDVQLCIVLSNLWGVAFFIKPTVWSAVFAIAFSALGVFFKVVQ